MTEALDPADRGEGQLGHHTTIETTKRWHSFNVCVNCIIGGRGLTLYWTCLGGRWRRNLWQSSTAVSPVKDHDCCSSVSLHLVRFSFYVICLMILHESPYVFPLKKAQINWEYNYEKQFHEEGFQESYVFCSVFLLLLWVSGIYRCGRPATTLNLYWINNFGWKNKFRKFQNHITYTWTHVPSPKRAVQTEMKTMSTASPHIFI